MERCDGQTPVCGPCRKDPGRDQDCEYSSNAPSTTHRLEQKVTELRARLRDLERARIHSERAGPVPSVPAASSPAEGMAQRPSSSGQVLHSPQSGTRGVPFA